MDLVTVRTASATAPIYTTDQRPSADAAATRHDVRPPASDAPYAIVPSSPSATIGKSLLDSAIEDADAVIPLSRVLKPYGLIMLPDTAAHGAKHQPIGETSD